jgi:rod shape-determining protein MreC
MRNLIQLFIRNGGALTFWGLQVICFFLIVQFNEAQGEIFISSLNNANGYLDERMESAQDFLGLRETNDSLARENARLYQQLHFQSNRVTPDSLPTFSSEDSLYQFIPARIIKNSINRSNNYIRLNKGRKDGIEPNMGVISQFGVVGVVVDVSENYALVMSLLHQQSRISASIANKGYFGSMIWPGGDPTEALLLDVPKHAQIEQNDYVETSGYSLLFPPHLPLGRIDTFWVDQGNSSYTIELNLTQDLANLDYAYVVKVPNREEQRSLESGLE